MLPKSQGNEANVKQDEDWNVDEGVWVLVEKLDCVFQHVALELDLVGVHAQHDDQNQSQQNQ